MLYPNPLPHYMLLNFNSLIKRFSKFSLLKLWDPKLLRSSFLMSTSSYMLMIKSNVLFLTTKARPNVYPHKRQFNFNKFYGFLFRKFA